MVRVCFVHEMLFCVIVRIIHFYYSVNFDSENEIEKMYVRDYKNVPASELNIESYYIVLFFWRFYVTQMKHI